jgi:EAL domain-containing protein (putative c-di-GMP-specific phosphodiesterase class I)/GGDEF domain-containing protein
MSLISQLRITTLIVLMLAISGSFVLNTLSIQRTLTEELETKNSDNATALALSMSQLEKDATTLDLLISAQFDSGQYQYIGLFDPNGNLITERKNTTRKTIAPRWFTKLVSINAQPGIADIQDHWKQYGSLKIKSDVIFAYDKLWKTMAYTGIFALLIGLLGYYLCGHFLKKIIAPLNTVIKQAKAIELHQFITIDEPKVFEFKALAHAMNSLSNRIKKTVDEESERLEELRHKLYYDPFTGLMHHHYFMHTIESYTKYHENFTGGVLVVIRLANLSSIDKVLDYHEINKLLKEIGTVLKQECKTNTALVAARLTGSDFAIFCNQAVDELELANQIKNRLLKTSYAGDPKNQLKFLTVTTKLNKFDDASNSLNVLDNILDISSSDEENSRLIINASKIAKIKNADLKKWESNINDALSNKWIKLEYFPVVTAQNKLIHFESPVRLKFGPNKKWLVAGDFIFWATKLNLINKIDGLVLEHAVSLISKDSKPLCIHISSQTLLDTSYLKNMKALVKKNLKLPQLLCFDIDEAAAFGNIKEFRYACNEIKNLGCTVGVEHVGQQISRLGELHDLGLDYIKIDVALIREINTNEANKTLLRGLCIIAHSMGLTAIAEGIRSAEEIESLNEIGIDGMSGPAIKKYIED